MILTKWLDSGEAAASSKPAKSEEAEPISLVTIIDVVESGEDLAVSAVTVESKLLEPNVPHNKDYKLSSNEVTISFLFVDCFSIYHRPVRLSLI